MIISQSMTSKCRLQLRAANLFYESRTQSYIRNLVPRNYPSLPHSFRQEIPSLFAIYQDPAPIPGSAFSSSVLVTGRSYRHNATPMIHSLRVNVSHYLVPY